MIITARKLPYLGINIAAWVITRLLKRRFNKLTIHPVKIKPGYSYLLMCNHLSFWDGFWAAYLSYKTLNNDAPFRSFYVMILKKQLQKNKWLRYFGCFSIAHFGNTIHESIDYAADKLNSSGNILLLFPQGNLESNYVRHIEFKKQGILDILTKTTGRVQIIWCSNLIEYFESLKPSVHFHMLDCGTNDDFIIETLSDRINAHHQAAMKKHFRFTEEPD